MFVGSGTNCASDLCRFCASKSDNMIDIFGMIGEPISLQQKVDKCLPILVSKDDALSTLICQNCIHQLDAVFGFFELCLISNIKLSTSLKLSPEPYIRHFSSFVTPVKVEPEDFVDVEDFLCQGNDDGNVSMDEFEECLVKCEDQTDFYNGIEKKRKGIVCRGRPITLPLVFRRCSLCSCEFNTNSAMILHWEKMHFDEMHEAVIIYKCRQENCNFTSDDDRTLNNHCITSHGLTRNCVKKSSNFHEYRCDICGKRCESAYHAKRHMLGHSTRKTFLCEECKKSFKSLKDLTIHSRTHQPDQLKLTHCCELCGKRFSQRANLECHLRVHSGSKPFKCSDCGKLFSQKGNMMEHQRTHTGERPFVCDVCGMSFIRRSEMLLHFRCIHTKERPFKCEHCPKTFQRRDLMKKHERIHTNTRPYTCEYCAKTFTQRDKLVVHRRLHTGERPYVCHVCGKGFNESGNMKKHLRVHGKSRTNNATKSFNVSSPVTENFGGTKRSNNDISQCATLKPGITGRTGESRSVIGQMVEFQPINLANGTPCSESFCDREAGNELLKVNGLNEYILSNPTSSLLQNSEWSEAVYDTHQRR